MTYNPYMLTGAIAVSYHGMPRATYDIAIVILVVLTDIGRIKAMLEPDFSVAEEPIKAALWEEGVFNAIHEEIGLKVDFWTRRGDDFSHEAFARRKRYPYGDKPVSIATPEDMSITKLAWNKLSDLDKHYFDARVLPRARRADWTPLTSPAGVRRKACWNCGARFKKRRRGELGTVLTNSALTPRVGARQRRGAG